tara:strand:- start:6 stop:1079 length:1074 start_codon:yes stop_codon:yes gene_type:complete
MHKTSFNIANKKVGLDCPTYFIADIAANHDGDIERAKSLIYQAAEAGADAAKFQHFQAETIVSNKGFVNLKSQLSHQKSWKKSVFEVYSDASVSLDWTTELVETCKKAGIPFFTTPYSLEVVDFMDEYVPAYKIGSGDITWLEMIDKVAKKNKPYLIASGASNFEEVVMAVETGLNSNDNLCLMQCNTNYTASIENFKYINLNVIKTYQSMFPGLIIGLSDHTPGCTTVLGSVSLGARIIEKHFTDDNDREGPDHKFSMNPKSWKEMVTRTRELESSLGNGIKKIEDNEKETSIIQRRSLMSTKDILKGETITEEHIKAVRPCPINALNPFMKSKILGKKSIRDIEADSHFLIKDLY